MVCLIYKGCNLLELHSNVYKTLKDELDKVNSKESKIEDAGLEEMKQLMMMLLYNWEDDYYMAIASLAALRSKDGRTAVSRSFSSRNEMLLLLPLFTQW